MTTPNNGQSSDSSSPVHRTTSIDEVVQTHITPGRLTHGPIWFYDVEQEEEVFEESDDDDYDYEENTDNGMYHLIFYYINFPLMIFDCSGG